MLLFGLVIQLLKWISYPKSQALYLIYFSLSVLGKKNTFFFKGCSSSVSCIFFFFLIALWLRIGFSLFSMTPFPFYFPAAVKLPDTFISFPVIKACCKQVKRWNAAFTPADAVLPLNLKGWLTGAVWGDFSHAWCWWDTTVRLKDC